MIVSVAIPVLNGGVRLSETFAAVRRQELPEGVSLEVVVSDSGSTDGSRPLAAREADVLFDVAPGAFSHGATRNDLVDRAAGELVALLTQDAVPAAPGWLRSLIEPFATTPDLGLAFGPYQPLPRASPMVARELEHLFAWFSPDGTIVVDRLGAGERGSSARSLLGRAGYFTDANGCLRRSAWERTPFRPVAYAEDHVLAHDMLRAGFAKAFVPAAAVVHSHDYGGWEWLQRSFDESRALREIYEWEDLGSTIRLARLVRGSVRADLRWGRANGLPLGRLLAGSVHHHTLRALGTALGARATGLPATVTRRLSLERRH